jgi:hypothetical protein
MISLRGVQGEETRVPKRFYGVLLVACAWSGLTHPFDLSRLHNELITNEFYDVTFSLSRALML